MARTPEDVAQLAEAAQCNGEFQQGTVLMRYNTQTHEMRRLFLAAILARAGCSVGFSL